MRCRWLWSSYVVLLCVSAVSFYAEAAQPGVCAEGIQKFRYLNSWATKLENFKIPVETGTIRGSEVFSIGAVLAPADVFLNYSTQGVGGWASSVRGRSLSFLLTPLEKKLLAECTKFPCAIKFQKKEYDEILKTSGVARQNKFIDILNQRISQYQKKSEVIGYEDARQPQWTERLWPNEVPVELGTSFLRSAKRTDFGIESYDPEPGKHKPVSSVFARGCEERGELDAKYHVCTEISIYNNHYFDFWARTIFFFPWCGKTLVLGYETADVDQIKSSKMVGLIFGSEIRRRFATMLESRLKQISVLTLTP